MKRSIFRSVPVFMLLLVFLAGSTGFTFIRHSCLSSGTTGFSAYPEVFQKEPSCCCETFPASATLPGSAFNDEDCCKNIRGFIKFPVAGFPVLSFHVLNPVCLPLSPLLDQNRPRFFENDFNILLSNDDPSPPPGGKALVLSIHQIKIPFPVAL